VTWRPQTSPKNLCGLSLLELASSRRPFVPSSHRPFVPSSLRPLTPYLPPVKEPLDPRDSILHLLKRERTLSITELAERLAVTYEAVRQQLIALERDGLVRRRVLRPSEKAVGRPNAVYSLTRAGDHQFEKRYDELALALITGVGESLGADALHTVLATISDARVRQWEPRLRGRMLERRVELLRSFYADDDPFMQIEVDDEDPRLVEHNCPYLDVAMAAPAICSTTVSALSRLLGYEVVREERFQDGDRRCVFRVRLDEPSTIEEFRLEPARSAR
jgi:predicted ArsR family transcriptional regulator